MLKIGEFMSNETTDNFWAAFGQVPDLVPVKIFYRLYYNDRGCPLFYSMEDIPGNYIDIDQEIYAESPSQVRVVNGQLIRITSSATTKLVPGVTGTACDSRDVCVIVSETQPHTKWNLKTYEPN
jgi:hypothetical protein